MIHATGDLVDAGNVIVSSMRQTMLALVGCPHLVSNSRAASGEHPRHSPDFRRHASSMAITTAATSSFRGVGRSDGRATFSVPDGLVDRAPSGFADRTVRVAPDTAWSGKSGSDRDGLRSVGLTSPNARRARSWGAGITNRYWFVR